jgi:uncharacterized repeat protein (TIGR01451 family)
VSVVLLCSWFACDRPTPVAPSESTLTITANPLRIAVDGTALVSVLARKSDGTAVNPGTEINFSTSLGTIDQLIETDQRGVAEAVLTGDGRIGMATVTAESGAAGVATIDIQIGALASFIDFTANPQTINKDLPSRGEEIKLKAIVRDDLNNVIRGVAVSFEAEIGTLESGGSVTNVNGVARDTLTVTSVAGISDGFFEIEARTAGEDGSEVSEFVEITVTGFAFDITLSVQPTSIPATGGVVQLSALVRDDEFEAAVGEKVNFVTEAGNLASGGGLVTTDEGGQAFDTLTVTQADLAALPATATFFNVFAEVGGGGGELIDSGNVPIRVQPAPPVANFGFSAAGLTATFSNTTTGGLPLTFSWDFGDGDSSTLPSPSHVYAVAGTYSVTLAAANEGGSDSITKAVTVVDPVVPTFQLNINNTFVSEADVDMSGTRNAGDTLLYQIVATNTGDQNLTNVTIASTLPEALSCLPAQPAILVPSEALTCTLTHTITPVEEAAALVVNLATADSNETPQVSKTVTVTVP